MDEYKSETTDDKLVNFQILNDRYHTGHFYHDLPEYFDEAGKYLLQRTEDGHMKRINAIKPVVEILHDMLEKAETLKQEIVDDTKQAHEMIDEDIRDLKQDVITWKSKLLALWNKLVEKIKWLLPKQ